MDDDESMVAIFETRYERIIGNDFVPESGYHVFMSFRCTSLPRTSDLPVLPY